MVEKINIDGNRFVIDNDKLIKVSISPVTKILDKFPENIKSIEDTAIIGGKNLERIVLPEGITYIGERPFYDCSKVKEISIPNSVTKIDAAAFFGCYNLEKINLPENLKTLGRDAFLGCKELKEIIIPNGITTIEGTTFNVCTKLTKVILPESITEIKNKAFAGCKSLKEIILPKNLTEIESEAFSECYNLLKINIPEGVKEIKDGTFNECINLQEIIIPKNITKIGSQAFSDCHKLKEIALPEGITKIGSQAFSGCYELNEIALPEGITAIEAQTFSDCYTLKEIAIPEGVTKIGPLAFYECKNLQKLTLPKGVTILENKILAKCRDLKEITIPEGVIQIGNGTFGECINLKEINLPKSIKTIGQNTFFGCKNLQKIAIPEGVTEINSRAFYECNNLQEITLPEGLTSIATQAFFGCKNLQRINIPEGLKIIGDDAFSNCDSLVEIILPDGIERVGKFSNAENIEVKYKGLSFYDNRLDQNKTNKYFYNYIHNLKEIYTRNNLLDNYTINELQPIIDKKIYYNEDNIKLFEKIGDGITSYIGEICKEKESISNHIYDNMKYLMEQNLIDKDLLQEIYLGFKFDFDGENQEENKKEFERQLHDNMNNIDVDLLLTLNSEDKLELRDRLIFVSTMKYLDKDSDYIDIESAISMLKRNRFSNLIDVDRKQYNKYFDFRFGLIDNNDYFNGIKYHLTKELIAINPKLIRLFTKNPSVTNKFIKSLNTINNWDNYTDPKDRATILKNEIVGRIVYGLTRISAEKTQEYQDYKNGLKDFNSYRSFINNTGKFLINYQINTEDEQKFINYICKPDFNDLAAKENREYTNQDKEDRLYIYRLMNNNPYIFDIFRGNKKIDNIIYNDAYQKGYLFKSDELSNINTNYSTSLKAVEIIAYAIINDIGIHKIPEENEKQYLDNINALIDSYFEKEIKTEDDYYSIFRGIDVYLRKNAEYDYQELKNPQSKELSLKIFDYKKEDNNSTEVTYNNEDRLCYCLYNLNRLAHSIEDVNTCVIKIEAKKYKQNQVYANKVIENGIKGYNNIQKYGIPIKTINSGVINSARLNTLVNTQILYNKINTVKKELNRNTNNNIEKTKTKLMNLISGDLTDDNQLNIISKEELNSVNTKDELINLIETFNSNNENIINNNLQSLKEAIYSHVQLNEVKTNDITEATPEEINRLANNIYNIKQLDEKTREKIKMDAEEQRLFFKTKSLVATKFLKDLNKFIKTRIASAIEYDDSIDFYKENGYLIEFQHNNSGDLLVCYNPKFQEPFSIHMQDMSMLERELFQELSTNTIAYTKCDSGLTETKQIECNENEILPRVVPGFNEESDDIKKSIKVYNFLKFDSLLIKDEIDEFLKNNPSIDNIDSFIEELNSKIPITNADTVKFEQDANSNEENKTIKELYESTIGFSRLNDRKNLIREREALNEMLYSEGEISREENTKTI